MAASTRYTTTTRSLFAGPWAVAVEGSYARKAEALAAAQAALTRHGVTRARVVREVYTQAIAEWVVKGEVVFTWEEVAEVKELSRPATREEVAAVVAAAR